MHPSADSTIDIQPMRGERLLIHISLSEVNFFQYPPSLSVSYWGTYISCNMGRRDLPDMHARSPRDTGSRAEGIHIREILTAHVTNDMYHFWHSKNLHKQN